MVAFLLVYSKNKCCNNCLFFIQTKCNRKNNISCSDSLFLVLDGASSTALIWTNFLLVEELVKEAWCVVFTQMLLGILNIHTGMVRQDLLDYMYI